jgi:serine/threonine-protein kinase RsbW
MSQPLKVEMLRIPSSLDELPHVDAEVERVARQMGFGDSACADLGICVTEAAGNAITHAHHQQPERLVEIRFEQLSDSLRVVVRDHGAGFDVEKIPDPTLPENLLKPSGRGLHVIRSLMDSVEVKRLPDGMCIAMVKKLSSSTS